MLLLIAHARVPYAPYVFTTILMTILDDSCAVCDALKRPIATPLVFKPPSHNRLQVFPQTLLYFNLVLQLTPDLASLSLLGIVRPLPLVSTLLRLLRTPSTHLLLVLGLC